MFLVVWAIYLFDRLVDVARCRDWDHATGRLEFGRRYRPLFVACLVCCVAGIGAVLWLGLPPDVLRRATLVAGEVAVHFLLFVVPVVFGEKLPGKEFGVGLFFALGANACLGGTWAALPLYVAVTAVVAYNCLVIAARDTESDRANDPGGASRWWGTLRRDLLWTGAAVALAAGAWAYLTDLKPFALAVSASFAALTALLRYDQKFSGDAVRALADFTLLTPLPVFAAVALARG